MQASPWHRGKASPMVLSPHPAAFPGVGLSLGRRTTDEWQKAEGDRCRGRCS